MDVLDSEASEDEAVRKQVPMKRPPSHEANQELVQKQKRYRSVLTQAAGSDAVVRQRWKEWEKPISQLTLDEVHAYALRHAMVLMVIQSELESLVPSSTITAVATDSQTQVYARALRGLLETLDDIRHSRVELVSRAQRRGEADDIRAHITTVAGKIDRDAEITPAMFTDVSDQELAKYDRFIQGLVEGQKKQEELLEAIKVHPIFMASSHVSHRHLVHKRQVLILPEGGWFCERA